MKKLNILAIAAVLLMPFIASAEAPQGYYGSLEGLSSSELKTAIHKLVRNFTQVSSYNDLPRYFARTDVHPGTSQWWDMYSSTVRYSPSFSGLNREHSFPKSWWGGNTGVPAYVDLNHLYPSDAKANSAKSNYPLGIVDRTEKLKFDNGVTTVGYPIMGQGGGCQYVFEPADEYKGDFARTYFYMVTCYQDFSWSYTYMVTNGTYPTLNGWSQRLLLQWNQDDPVSQKELDRNDVVYSIQNNRNPFIDHPELADYIWGDKVGQPFHGSSSDQPTGDPVLINPAAGTEVDFGQVALGSSTTAEVFFRGENLTGALDLVLTGTDKAMFKLPTNSLSASLVNAPDGTWIRITYTPTALGEHTARLVISEGGMLGGSRGIGLVAGCLPVPTLTACTATAATDVTADSYTANWISPEGEEVDYWVVTRDKYVGGNVTREELIAEDPWLVIEDFDQSDSEAYSVQSVRLGYRSPISNVIFVDHNSITGVEADQGLIVQGFDGCIRFVCSAPQTGARIYDSTGRCVAGIDSIHNNLDYNISAGVYLVTTDQAKRPIKVVVR